jgi:NAD(P)-dependent dehydrogenase (short-subunit alcohol dehydrogenase family)
MENREREVTEADLLSQAKSGSPVASYRQKFAQGEQELPGSEAEMNPRPLDDDPEYKASGKLEGQTAIITGGDSGIGRAVAIAFAKEGADVAIVYISEEEDAQYTVRKVESYGRRCLPIRGDIGDEEFCKSAVQKTIDAFGSLSIVVNNAAEQTEVNGIEEVTSQQLERTFRTNIFGYFYMSKAALPHLSSGASIINTTSIQAIRPSANLIDYATTKGAIVTFTKALAHELTKKGIRVNAVAPGPVWTPLIAASFEKEKIQKFGNDSPLKRPAQPAELAPTYVYLASLHDSGYVSGEVIFVTGGKGIIHQ